MDRRDMLKSIAALGALPLIAGYEKAEAAMASTKQKGKNNQFCNTDLLEARRKARRRVRRVIMNNDGNDSALSINKPMSRELFLSRRTTALIESQVDSIFYCNGVNNVYSHLSQVSELPRSESKQKFIKLLQGQDTDTLSVMIDFCRLHGKEIFWSMRMNDNHDATTEFNAISRYKQQHPELMVGTKGVKMPFMYNKWSAFDYGQEQVRQLSFDILKDVVTRYDVDGIELDFFRHPAFFKAQFYGEPVTQADCDKMTQLVQRVRKMCDEQSVRRGRPVLIAIRVPDSLGFSKAIGLDWEQWLKQDLIDVVTGADYVKFEPWTNFAQIGQKYDVPVYACLEQRRLSGRGGDAGRDTTLERWRGEAYIAWSAGMNGIYTFNRFDPHDQLFRELGDPTLLAKLPMIREESYIGAQGIGYLDPGYWVMGGRDFLRK